MKNRRRNTLFFIILAGTALCSVTLAGGLLYEGAAAADFAQKNLPPCPLALCVFPLAHPSFLCYTLQNWLFFSV